jgi:hypothetical protein
VCSSLRWSSLVRCEYANYQSLLQGTFNCLSVLLQFFITPALLFQEWYDRIQQIKKEYSKQILVLNYVRYSEIHFSHKCDRAVFLMLSQQRLSIRLFFLSHSFCACYVFCPLQSRNLVSLIISCNSIVFLEPGWRSLYSDSLRAGRSGDRIPVGAKFSASVQTGSEPTQPPVQWLPGLSRGKGGQGVVLTIHRRLVCRG